MNVYYVTFYVIDRPPIWFAITMTYDYRLTWVHDVELEAVHLRVGGIRDVDISTSAI